MYCNGLKEILQKLQILGMSNSMLGKFSEYILLKVQPQLECFLDNIMPYTTLRHVDDFFKKKTNAHQRHGLVNNFTSFDNFSVTDSAANGYQRRSIHQEEEDDTSVSPPDSRSQRSCGRNQRFTTGNECTDQCIENGNIKKCVLSSSNTPGCICAKNFVYDFSGQVCIHKKKCKRFCQKKYPNIPGLAPFVGDKCVISQNSCSGSCSESDRSHIEKSIKKLDCVCVRSKAISTSLIPKEYVYGIKSRKMCIPQSQCENVLIPDIVCPPNSRFLVCPDAMDRNYDTKKQCSPRCKCVAADL